MCHRSESCYHFKYTLKTLVTNFNLSEKQRSTLFLNKTLPVLLRNSVYSVLHHAEPNVPVQFMYVDQYWWQRQQIMAETSFLCQPSHLWWGAELYPSNHWVGCRAVPSHQPISGHTHNSLTPRYSWESPINVFLVCGRILEKWKTHPHRKKSRLHTEWLQDFLNLWGN